MKKTIFSMIAIAMAAFSFTACEDVPAPYDTPNNEGGGETVLPEGVLLDQSFEKSLGNFTSASQSGTLQWKNDYSSAMVTGYQDFDGDGTKENQAGVTFLVSPEIDLTNVKEAHITVNHAINYERGDINKDNSILVSKDYSGNVATATWEVLNYNTDGLNASFDFAEKSVNIPDAYMGGKVVIAFRHTCTASSSSTWEVKSVKVQTGKVDEPTIPDNPGTDTGVATGDGTQANPFNSVAANKYASSLAENAESDKDVYIKGKVVSIKENYGDSSYGNATFYISDDGTATDQFYVFRALYIGNKKYESGAKLAVGDSVVVCGKVTNYKGNTPETVANKAWLVSIKTNGGDNPGTDIEGTTYDVSKLFDTTTELSTVTMKDGLKLTFDGGGNTIAPKFYTTGGGAIRVYPKNTIKVEASKKIKALQFVCDDYQGGYTASGDVTASTGGKPTLEGTKLTFTGINATTVTFTNVSQQTGQPSQMRIKQIIVAYE